MWGRLTGLWRRWFGRTKQLAPSGFARNDESWQDYVAPGHTSGQNITTSRGPLCCNDCDSVLTSTQTGGYWCKQCQYSPSMQDTYVRKWADD